MVMPNRGRLVVISGPSGTGKGTVISQLMRLRDDVRLSISVTTRAPRGSEVDGKDYFFISREKFDEMVDENMLLEHAEYVGSCYGTPRAFVEENLAAGKSVILEIDVQGAEQIAASSADAVLVFILPPSGTELERRLRGRHTDSEEKIRSRLLAAKRECAEAGKYDYIVVNDSAEAAAREVDAIITAEKCRAELRKKLVTEVLIS